MVPYSLPLQFQTNKKYTLCPMYIWYPEGSFYTTSNRSGHVWSFNINFINAYLDAKNQQDASFPLLHIADQTSLTFSFPMHLFPNPWKHQKTSKFSDDFKGQKKVALGMNGLKLSLKSFSATSSERKFS